MTDRVPPYTPTWEERHAFHAYPLPGCPLCERDLDASSNRVCVNCGRRKGDHTTAVPYGGTRCTEFRAADAIPNSVAMTDDYKRARGAASRQPGEPRAEERIRASRDADATRNRVVKAKTYWGQAYLEGWRAAMTEAKGGDWSQEVPDGW